MLAQVNSRWIPWQKVVLLVEVPGPLPVTKERIAKDGKIWYTEDGNVYPVSFVEQDEFDSFLRAAELAFAAPVEIPYGGCN